MPNATTAVTLAQKQEEMSEFILIGGPCAIEDDNMPFVIGREVKRICDNLGIRYIFKGSYRKANHTKQFITKRAEKRFRSKRPDQMGSRELEFRFLCTL